MCTGDSPVLHLEPAGGYLGVDGVVQLTGDDATFGAGILAPILELNVASGSSEWQIQISNSDGGLPTVGQYVSGSGSDLQIIMTPQGGCISIPTGPFGIAQLSTDTSAYASVTQAAVWFDLQCPEMGSLRGFAAFGPP